MLVTCPGCGAEVPEDAGFCRGCGTILRGRAAPVKGFDRPTVTSPSRGEVGVSPTSRRDHSATLDYGMLAAALVVCASSLLVWYERTTTIHGANVTVTARLLSGDAGVQRPLVPAIAGFLAAEILLNRLTAVRGGHELRWHRAIVLASCVAEVVLVGSCIASSPLSPNQLANLGISLNPAPGSFVGLVAAGVALLIALLRMFSGRPSLAGSRGGA